MISLIKLKNGTEIIGSLKKVGESIVIEDPIQINYKSVDRSMLPVVSFTRYCPFSAENLFKFDSEYVLHITPVKEALEKYYQHSVIFHREVVDKHIDQELINVLREESTDMQSGDDEIEYLKRVKIDGYPQ